MILFVMAAALLIALLALAACVFVRWKRRFLHAGAQKEIRILWQKAQQQTDATVRILEADKVLDRALTLLGYTGTLGEKLRQAGPRFLDINGVWAAHKLRNALAHDIGRVASTSDCDRAMRSFERALTDLGL